MHLSHSYLRWVVVFGCLAVHVPPGHCCAGEDEAQESRLAQIERVWRKRQDSTRSGHVTWSQRRFIRAGTFGDEPTEDVFAETDGHFLMFRGRLMKYGAAVMKLSGHAPGKSVVAFNGERNMEYLPPSTFHYGFGNVWGMKKFRERSNLNVWPVLLHYRPLGEFGIGLDVGQLRVEGEGRLNRDGVHILCILVRGKAGTAFGRYRFWVAKLQDWPILRVEKGYEDDMHSLRARIEIVFDKKIDESRRRHTHWSITYMKVNGEVFENIDASVHKVDVDAEVEPSEFTLQFPSGTVVDDFVSGDKYILGVGGKHIAIQPGLSYDEMVARSEQVWGGREAFLGLGMLVFAGFLGYACWRQWRDVAK